MKHLILRQAMDRTEQVDSSCINDLYEFTLQLAQNPDDTSYLQGKINTSVSSKDKINVLHTLDDQNPPVPVTSNNEGKWNDLFVTAGTYTIEFKDKAFQKFAESYLNDGNEFTSSNISSIGSEIKFRGASAQPDIQSLDDLALFTSVTNIWNMDGKNIFPNVTSITVPRSCQNIPIDSSFEEKLQHFTSLSANINISIERCKKLEDITTLSYNSIYIGGCISLKKVNVENVPARTELRHGAVYGCTSLEDLDFIPEEFTFNGYDQFHGLTQFESLPVSPISSEIPQNCYYECKSWKGDAIFPPITTTFKNGCLSLCSSLTSIIITATSVTTNGTPFDTTTNPWGNPKKGCPIYVPLASKDSIIQGDTGMSNYSQGNLLSGSTDSLPGYVVGRVFGYRILRHNGSSWQNVSDFGTGKAAMDLVKEARKNSVIYNNTTDVPSTGSNGDLAFAIYAPSN